MKSDPSRIAALLEVVSMSLERQLREEPRVVAACAGLQRLGLALTLRLEAAPGSHRPSVVLSVVEAEVPQWSEEDRDALRSLGIVLDASPAKPRRRQSL